MPNLIGLPYQTALALMQSAGVRSLPLGYFQVDPVTTSWLKALASQPGFVLNQSIAAGTLVTANVPVLMTVSSYPMAVSGDTPVQTSPLVPDVMYDQPGSTFILNESILK